MPFFSVLANFAYLNYTLVLLVLITSTTLLGTLPSVYKKGAGMSYPIPLMAKAEAVVLQKQEGDVGSVRGFVGEEGYPTTVGALRDFIDLVVKIYADKYGIEEAVKAKKGTRVTFIAAYVANAGIPVDDVLDATTKKVVVPGALSLAKELEFKACDYLSDPERLTEMYQVEIAQREVRNADKKVADAINGEAFKKCVASLTKQLNDIDEVIARGGKVDADLLNPVLDRINALLA